MLDFLSTVQLLLASASASSILWLLYTRFLAKRSPYPLPPSPSGALPFIGHLLLNPATNPEGKYIEWGRQLRSDVIYLNILGRPIVILNSVQAANDLMDKRGLNYADRPRFVLFEMMGWGITLTFLRWGAMFRKHRKLMQNAFSATNIKQFRFIQEQEARQAVRDMLMDPQRWEPLANKFATAVILRVGFGVGVEEEDHPYLKMAEKANTATTNGGTPASSLVDFFPLARFLPSWLACSSAMNHARASKPVIQQIHDVLFTATEKHIRDGNTKPSFLRTHLETFWRNSKEGRENEFTLADIKGAAGAIFIAGGNTTWSTITVSILNMLVNPEVQKKAQDELDSVIGRDRLPNLADRPSLPYMAHIIQETYRWAPLSPLGVPHKTLEDDIYKGMLIPKGSVVYANAKAMTHDESTYRDPSAFNPDRYVSKECGGAGEPFPQGPFGFGRRACPGRWLADASVFIFMSTLLSIFNIEPALGPDGKPLKPKFGLSNGLSSHPEHFDCTLTPRSPRSVELIMGGAEDSEI